MPRFTLAALAIVLVCGRPSPHAETLAQETYWGKVRWRPEPVSVFTPTILAFRRGDVDDDGEVGPADATVIIQRLFASGKRTCATRGVRAVPYLVEGLRHDDWQVRYLSARLLDGLKGEARAAVPLLRVVLQDEDEVVRWTTAWALESILGDDFDLDRWARGQWEKKAAAQ